MSVGLDALRSGGQVDDVELALDRRVLLRIDQLGIGRRPLRHERHLAGAEGGVGLGIFVGIAVAGRRLCVGDLLVDVECLPPRLGIDDDLAVLVEPVAAIAGGGALEDHDVEEQVLHLQNGAVGNRAVGID